MSAFLTVERGAGWMDFFRAYRVSVDGEERLSLRRKSRRTLELAPGRYEVTARIDWCGSNALALDLAEGEEVVVRVSNHHGAVQSQHAQRMSPETYLKLEVERRLPAP